jgi:hypothetical protein
MGKGDAPSGGETLIWNVATGTDPVQVRGAAPNPIVVASKDRMQSLIGSSELF